MFVMLPRGDKVARRAECNFGNNNENEEVVIANNNTNTTAADVGVNNTCATTTTTTTAPGGHGGLLPFLETDNNPGNGNIYLLNEYFTLMLMYFWAWPMRSPKQHENASSC